MVNTTLLETGKRPPHFPMQKVESYTVLNIHADPIEITSSGDILET